MADTTPTPGITEGAETEPAETEIDQPKSRRRGIVLVVLAILLVGAAGFAVRAPLARVPENALKFLVGVMLTGFGAFWAAEGAGARWPGSDAALLVLLPGIAVLGVLLTAGLRRQGRARDRLTAAASPTQQVS